MESKKKMNNTTHRIAKEVVHKVLAHAFVMTKREGLKIYVASLDGQRSPQHQDQDPLRINVAVSNGVVQKSWIG